MSEPATTQPQHAAFADGEADAYFERNHAAGVRPADQSHGVAQAIKAISLPESGRCLDLGGSAGALAATISTLLPQWSFTITDPSPTAAAAGKAAFPAFDFRVETAEALAASNHGLYDLIIVSAVFHWVDRTTLARVVANVDESLKDRGRLVIHDFDPAFPRMNSYKHRPGLHTYKQNYAAIFTSLGIYELVYTRSEDAGSSANPADPYDRRWSTVVLQKTLHDRYGRFG